MLQAINQLNEWLNTEFEAIDAEHETEKRRLRKALDYISTVTTGLDPEFFPEQIASQINQQLRQPDIWENLKAYSVSPSAPPLRAANDYLTNSIPLIAQMAALSSPRGIAVKQTATEKSYDQFCKTIEKREKEFKTKLDELLAFQTLLKQQMDALKEGQRLLEQTAETTISAWQNDYTTAQTERAESFSKAQIDRATVFSEITREFRNKADQEIKDLSAKQTDKLESSFNKFALEAASRFKDMKLKHHEILEIHGLVGTDGVAGGYQKSATDEHAAANLWRMISMSALSLAAIWICVKYFFGIGLTSAGEVNWAQLATAASLTLVLLGASGYAARQSKLHREAEQQMKWFALEVKAIDPFLSSLPVEQQHTLKNQLSQKLFGQNRVTVGNTEDGVDPAVFKLFSDAIANVLKSSGKG
ncbi:MAG: hypothetical protein O9309_14395 [Rhizobium sp.]|nr:hypothetical protein [Rhizobium sp.]MCZ8348711.1 hypothetical protein [Rhizobium sp.]